MSRQEEMLDKSSGKRGLAVYEEGGRTCRSACQLVYFECCECNGSLNSNELDKFRYKVTHREKQWFFDKADTNKNGVLERNEVRALLDSIKQIPDPAFAVNNNQHYHQMAVPKVDDAELDLLIRLANKQSGSSVGRADVGQLIILHRVLSRNATLSMPPSIGSTTTATGVSAQRS